MKIDNTVLPERAAFALRLAVGVVFGLAMAVLGHSHYDAVHRVTLDYPLWRVVIYSTLGLTAFVWWAGAGTMRRVTLAAWGVITTAVVAGLAWCQAQSLEGYKVFAFGGHAGLLVLPLLFIAHELVSSGDQAGRVIAPYPTYFDRAWKHGVQLGLALLFTGLFWVILWLGAALLGLIGISWLKDLLEKDWFSLPASGAAMACAVQLGDVQDKLLTNVRALVLSVLSWLLPVIAVIGLLFLGGLCFSGLAPLWKTKAATATLLSACILFVLLINAAYQQGDAERPVNIVMKWAARLACFLLLAFAALSAFSLRLRIDEYGLSPERVLAAAGVVVACLFGLGYVAAAVWPGRWLSRVEGVNIAMAFVKLLIFLGLLTPLADPMRLGVADQVARLQSGRTPVDRFDWRLLRFETDRYGQKALAELAKSGRTDDIRVSAAKTAAWADTDRWTTVIAAPDAKFDDMRRLKVVYPSGSALPATFTGATLGAGGMRDCVQSATSDCSAALVDLNGDGAAEIVIRQGNELAVFTYTSGAWAQVETYAAYLSPEGIKAFKAGQIGTQAHAWSDLKVGTNAISIEGTK